MNTVSYNKSSKCPPTAFMYYINLFLKLLTALLIQPLANCLISSPVQISVQKLYCLQRNVSESVITPGTW